ncbi:MAG: molybdopterin-dependent oxidoreductase [Spirochaetales bacterium]|nr:molybdopterin-dependent oxidoreductase [Spirochaetales bacterium]
MARRVYTFCRICEAACGLEIEVDDNRIVRISPNRHHRVTRGFACPKGLRFHELEHSPDRLRAPMKRIAGASAAPGRPSGGFEDISWSQAFREIGAKVRQLRRDHGPDSIAMYAGNGAGFGLMPLFFAQGFIQGVGSKNVYSSATQDCSNKFAVAQGMYGFPMTQPLPDYEHADFLILVGANPVVSKFSFRGVAAPAARLRAAAARGARIVSVNPRRTETARLVGEQVFIRPDTDVFFLLAFARELIHTGGVDRERVDRHMRRYEQFAATVEPWTAERQAEVTGVSPETLRELVRAYREADGAALYCSTGINHGRNAALAFWILEAINAVSGNLDRRGGTLVGQGLLDFPSFAVKHGFMMGGARSRIGSFRAVADSLPGGILADEILTPGEGQVRALFVAAGNPALTLPDSNKVRSALQQLELLVCVDLFRSVTGNYAHYLLPAASFLQRADVNYIFQSLVGITDVPVLNYSDRVLEPAGEEKQEGWIYAGLAAAADLPFMGSHLLTRLIRVGRTVSRLGRIGRLLSAALTLTPERIFGLLLLLSGKTTLRRMRRRPHGLLLPPHQPGSFLGRRLHTPDGKVDLAPPVLLRAARGLEAHYGEELSLRGKIKLVSKRELLTHNSYFQNGPSFVRGRRGQNYLSINPEDAARLGLEQGGTALVATKRGSIRLTVEITADMMPGAVAVPFGWGQADAVGLRVARAAGGANVNLLTPSGPEHVDRVSGMAHLTGIPVEVRPA